MSPITHLISGDRSYAEALYSIETWTLGHASAPSDLRLQGSCPGKKSTISAFCADLTQRSLLSSFKFRFCRWIRLLKLFCCRSPRCALICLFQVWYGQFNVILLGGRPLMARSVSPQNNGPGVSVKRETSHTALWKGLAIPWFLLDNDKPYLKNGGLLTKRAKWCLDFRGSCLSQWFSTSLWEVPPKKLADTGTADLGFCWCF